MESDTGRERCWEREIREGSCHPSTFSCIVTWAVVLFLVTCIG